MVHHSREGMVPGAHGGICGNRSRHRGLFTLTGSGSRGGRLGPGTCRTIEGQPFWFLLKALRLPVGSHTFKAWAHSGYFKCELRHRATGQTGLCSEKVVSFGDRGGAQPVTCLRPDFKTQPWEILGLVGQPVSQTCLVSHRSVMDLKSSTQG